MLDNLHLRVFMAKWNKIKPSEWVYHDLHDFFWRLYLNKTDGAFLKLAVSDSAASDPEIYPLEGGKVYFIPAGVCFSTGIDREVDHFFVHFDVPGMPDLAMRTLFTRPICLPSSDWMQQIIFNLTGEIGSDQELMNKVDLILETQVKALLYQGLTLYLSTLPAERLAQPLQIAADQKPVLPAVNFINNNLALPLLNADLAQLCQMSEGYFNHLFKDCMGQTPGGYIREKRVKLAAQKLLFTTESIEQIAVSTGFGSRFYLTRIFTRSMGLSPAAYRKIKRA
jgi:AraC-like DNA-binding protein